MAVDLLPDAPDPANDQPQVFSQKAAAMVLAQKAMVPQINAEIAAMNAAIAAFNSSLAGNAYAIPYSVDLTSTADADPGAGKLRFNSATQNLATVMRLDLLGADTADYTKSLDTFDAATSSVKGTLRIVKFGDSRKFLSFNVAARAAPAGYRNVTVTPVDSSSANPFVNGEQVLLFFQRNGDKGDKGDRGDVGTVYTMYVRDERPSGTLGGAGSSANGGWNTRQLNTVKVNSIAGASLASNRLTLPAGTYDIDATSQGGYEARLRLYNVTDANVTEYGNSEGTPSASLRIRQLVLGASKTFEVQHFVGSPTGASDLGGAKNMTGVAEVYADITVRKIA